MNTILDNQHDYCKKHIIYPSDQAAVTHTVWNLATYFLKDPDIRVFDNFAYLFFSSQDPASGKSRALKITRELAYNPVPDGAYSASSLLTEVDDRLPDITTLIVDELDEMLAPGQEGSGISNFTRFVNVGYERGAVYVRRHLMEQRNIRTPAYCPKAFAGLSLARFRRASRTRTIQIDMLPATPEQFRTINRRIDKEWGQRLSEETKNIVPWISNGLKSIDEDSLSNLTSRHVQLWHPLLAVAKVVDEEWYQRTLDACDYFVNQKANPNEDTGRWLLGKLFQLYMSGKYRKGIWHHEFITELLPRELDQYRLLAALRHRGYTMEPTEFRRDGEKHRGFEWDSCLPFFSSPYLTEIERNTIITENVSNVSDVSGSDTVKEAAPAAFGCPAHTSYQRETSETSETLF
jgi:hypothetical protein